MKVPYSCCTTFPVADNGVLPSFKSIPAKYLSVDGFFNEPSGRAFAVGKFKVSEKVVALVVYTDNSGTMGENKSYRLFTFDSKTGSFLNACQLAAKMTTIDGGTLLSSVSSSSTVSGDFQINCDYNAMKAGKSVSQVIKMVIRPDGSIETVTQ